MSDPTGNQPAGHAVFESNLEICYEILLYLSSRLAQLPDGEVFEFVTGDPSANDKIPGWCEQRGYNLLKSATLPDGRMQFLIKKD